MSRSLRPVRNPASRWSPRLEPLESRRLFAVSVGSDLSTLSVIATDPADGSVVDQSPTTLDLTFNQPFDALSVSEFDVDVQRIAPDGSVLEDDGSLLSEPLDLSGTPQTLPVTIGGTLAPGQYRVVLLGSSMLSGVGPDGSPIPLANAGADQTVSTFTIAAPGPAAPTAPTLADSIDLGTLGPQATQTSGTLDLVSSAGNYQLYKVTLGPGHFWRLGAEVDAQRDGGTLNSVLALFDSQGHLLKSDELGRPDVPSDPYLFAGLEAGTYYLGISGAGDVPDTIGGYDPVAGQFGAGGLDQPGGPYRLQVVADVEDTPTSVQDAQLEYADPLDPRPTGITVVFSRAMDIASFVGSIEDHQFQGLQVVDQDGRSWPLSPVSYLESNSQFTFFFSEPLPAGHYTLFVPGQDGVTDLAGLPPVGQGGGSTPASTLATWDVGNAGPPPIPNNLGTVLADLTSTTRIQPGATVTYRFVSPAAGFYNLFTFASGGPLRVQAIGTEGQVARDTASPDEPLTGLMVLNCGTYYLQLTDTGSLPVDVSFVISRTGQGAEAVFDNGVGQNAALNLTLITPSTPAPAAPVWETGLALGPSPFGGAAGSVAAPVAAHGPGGPGASIPGTTFESFSGTAGLVLTLGNNLVGSPVAGAEQVGTVGPGTQTAVTALAANTPGVLQGISYGQSLGLSSGPSLSGGSGGDAAAPLGSAAAESPAYVDGALTVAAAPPAPEADLDRKALNAAGNWLAGLGSGMMDWIGSLTGTEPGTSGTMPAVQPDAGAHIPIERIVLSRDDLVRPRWERVEHADLTTPLGLGMISVLALRLQQPARRWVNRRKGHPAWRSSTPGTTPRGPHARI